MVLVPVFLCIVQHHGNELMLKAIHQNDIEQLDFLLKSHINPDTSFPFLTVFNPVVEQTPLQFAAKTGNIEATKVLLKHGADVNYAKGNAPVSALAYALAYRHFEIVKLLVENDADVNYETHELVSPKSIYRATISMGSPEAMDYMLEHGMLLKDNYWELVCHHIISDGTELARYFVNSPDYNVDCTLGMFYYCDITEQYLDSITDEALLFFIENGADIHAIPDGKQTSVVDMINNKNQSEFANRIIGLYNEFHNTVE